MLDIDQIMRNVKLALAILMLLTTTPVYIYALWTKHVYDKEHSAPLERPQLKSSDLRPPDIQSPKPPQLVRSARSAPTPIRRDFTPAETEAAFVEARRRIFEIPHDWRIPKSLSFSDLGALKSLPPEIDNHPDLLKLDLSSTLVSDLTPLAGMRRLKELNLSSTLVSDLTPLADMRRLEDLKLSSTLVSDLTPLAGLEALEDLDLSFTLVRDLTPLAGLQRLRRLDLESSAVTSLAPLIWRISAERLRVSGGPY